MLEVMRLAGFLVGTTMVACGFRPSDDLGASDAANSVSDGPRADVALLAIDAPRIAPFCDPSDVALVACYEFESSLADGSSHHNDPDIALNVTYGTGKVAAALVVSSTTEVDVADNTSFDVAAFTIEAWINPSQIPTGSNRAGILDCDQRFGFFLHSNGDLVCTGGTSLTVAAGVRVGQWTHVACTDDGATLTIYVDGTATSGAGGMPPTGPHTGITIGGNNPPGGGSPLDGSIDQLRLFGVARTAAQLCADAGKTSC